MCVIQEVNPKIKYNMKKEIIFLIATILCTSAMAKNKDEFIQDGFKYTIYKELSGRMCAKVSDTERDVPLHLSDDSTLTIPATVEYEGTKYDVEHIAYGAFACRPEIKRLIISEGITSMGGYAFYRCTNLISVQLPSTFNSITPPPYVMFDGCCNLTQVMVDPLNERYDSREGCNAIISKADSTLVFACLGTRIPKGVTTIGYGAFSQCEKIESIVVPEGIKRIEPNAFSNCPNLRNVSLPNTLEEIGYNAFNNCMSLESITIPKNVSRIIGHMPGGRGEHWNLFGGCYNLKEVKVDKGNKVFDSRNNCNALIDSRTDFIVAACGNSSIPTSVKGIARYAFSNSSITSIKIPKNITKIEDGAFWKCEFCTSITVDSKNPVYNSKDKSNAIIETKTGKLLQGCSRTIIPNNVREIADLAFYGVRLPPYLIIPEGVETIGETVFTSSCGIKYIKMPSTLKIIRKNAFYGCKDLEYVDMSKCSPQVGMHAFGKCSRLVSIGFSPSIGSIHELAFWSCPVEKWVMEQVNIQND